MYRKTSQRILSLWLPNWPVQRWLAAQLNDAALEPQPHHAHNGDPPRDNARDNPGDPSRASTSAARADNSDSVTQTPPLILWGNDARRGRVVVARCQQAQRLGVRPGMTLSQADSLVRGAARSTPTPNTPSPHPATTQSPSNIEPQLVAHDSQADLDALHAFAERCAERLSPYVALEPLDDFLWAGQALHQPQSLLLDVTGVDALYGSETALLQVASQLAQELGYQPRMAIADTVGAAWALSHYLAPHGTPSACLQRVTCEDTVAWIAPPGQHAEALQPLPTAALRVSKDTTVMLRRLGVHQIATLRQLPRSGLASRLGTALLQRLDQALGTIDEPLQIHHAAAANQAQVELEYPTDDRDILQHRLEGLVQRVTQHLAKHQHGALRMTCRFDLQAAESVELRLGLFKPTAAAAHLTRLFHGALERQHLSALVHRITLSATLIGPLGVRQPSLLAQHESHTNAAHDLSQLIDTLSGRLGRQRVLGIHTSHNPLPEEAVTWRPLTGQPIGTLVPGRAAPQRRSIRTTRRKRTRSNPSAQPQHPHSSSAHPNTLASKLASHLDPLRRPLTLLAAPQPLQPLTTPTTRPQRFRRGGQTIDVTRYWGPERLETGWWHGPLQRRDYYRVETHEGSWLWVYQDLREQRWFLHGYFS